MIRGGYPIQDALNHNKPQLIELILKYQLDGYLIPSNDEYINEYTPETHNRLGYFSGFFGSNGLMLVTTHSVLFFTDGRYTLQAQKLFGSAVQIHDFRDISQILKKINVGKVGFDPRLFTRSKIFQQLSITLNLHALDVNLVDEIWLDKPKRCESKVFDYSIKYAGQDREEKIEIIRSIIKEHKASAALITSCDSLCWALNIRGQDLDHTPVILAILLITLNKIYLVTDFIKNTPSPQIEIISNTDLSKLLREIDGNVLCDKSTASIHLLSLIDDERILLQDDICLELRACKNNIEIQNIIDGHILEGVSFCELLAFINRAQSIEELTEYDILLKLSQLRSKHNTYIMDSFHTICGFKENSAIIHYKPCAHKSQKLIGKGLLLIDSGGQYLGCTTDCTRVVALGGPPSLLQIERYTDVLKGHIALSTSRFPKGTSGANLDVLARQYLWAKSLDYPHGTGHGVGSFLGVHEGPIAINSCNMHKLQEGMVVSNEPGYYQIDFGIRIENLLYIQHLNGFLSFQNLTMVPYEKSLIDIARLSELECEYVKSYYCEIRNNLYHLLSSNAQQWFDNQDLNR